ncbi:hypothetical protein HMPREF9162_0435 [Selenomonas sp. oral taxon 137 str. F0430]|nr:hypothetical protein HMPREF9162_0435 [Selenomonas sp. oral taxon 137 str. F0430]
MKALPWDIADILPRVLRAGEPAGTLTPHGAALLDPSGQLRAGSRMAPPEGDAGTGMVGANAVRRGTGNISVGTSAFSMNVLEAPLCKVHKDIDIVMTPDGAPVAMVHTNAPRISTHGRRFLARLPQRSAPRSRRTSSIKSALPQREQAMRMRATS